MHITGTPAWNDVCEFVGMWGKILLFLLIRIHIRQHLMRRLDHDGTKGHQNLMLINKQQTRKGLRPLFTTERNKTYRISAVQARLAFAWKSPIVLPMCGNTECVRNAY